MRGSILEGADIKVLPLPREATADDLYELDEKAEIINGKIVLMSPTGFLPHRAAFNIATRLRECERTAGGGSAITDNAAAVSLPHCKSFSPKAAWYTGAPTGGRFMQGGPVCAVEVRSERDYGLRAERTLMGKRADYFAAGTQVVWKVDLLRVEAEPSVPG